MKTSFSFGRRLTWIQVGRLAVLGSLCAFGIAVLDSEPVRTAYLISTAAVIGNGLLFAIMASRSSRLVPAGWVLCAVDSLIIGVILHFAGGVDGPFALIFLLHALLAGNLLGVRGGAWMALIDTAVLGASGLLTINGISPAAGSLMVSRLGLTMPSTISYQYVSLRVFLHALMLLSAGLVSGYFSELVRRQSGRLQDALDALRANRAGSRDILENLADGILVLDAEGIPLGINHSIQEMLDLGEDWDAEVRTTQVYRLLAGYQKAGVFPENIDLVSGDRILECRMGIFHDSYSSRPGAMAVLTDVTEIRTLRSRLEEREKLAVVGRLSATMAHEIRNPLASISGAAQVIRTGTLDEAGTARMVEMIIGQSRRASDIIEGYLEVARGGRMREETELRLDRLISVVVEGAARSYGQNLEIVLHPMPEVTIRGKEQRLVQIFENLLRNSAEAIGSLPDGRMDVKLTILDDEKVRISMRDNGPGMPDETLAKASEPFFTTKEFGTGLGLYVARRVVEEHDGRIRFVTPEGGGLEVIIELPVSGDSE